MPPGLFHSVSASFWSTHTHSLHAHNMLALARLRELHPLCFLMFSPFPTHCFLGFLPPRPEAIAMRCLPVDDELAQCSISRGKKKSQCMETGPRLACEREQNYAVAAVNIVVIQSPRDNLLTQFFQQFCVGKSNELVRIDAIPDSEVMKGKEAEWYYK
ncbi:LAME_0C06568g1_1 [Lachancea meyersii CBS 8951]|uniref:LAME_0C06568g1_1 n=1 Tax=Lachancea meyersii CBS 8951 TaxID=1266667 RepID=A0A1G4J2G3_9SACH|nr:LAME_0C06568g1_1 [Lachancea meyersii CBS 8951]